MQQNGNPRLLEYPLAVAELGRLARYAMASKPFQRWVVGKSPPKLESTTIPKSCSSPKVVKIGEGPAWLSGRTLTPTWESYSGVRIRETIEPNPCHMPRT